MIYQNLKIQNLFIDANCAIHPCCHPSENPPKNEDKAQRAVEHILDNRSRVEKVKLKRVGEKKKNLTIEE